MKTIERGHDVQILNSAGRNLVHSLDYSTDHKLAHKLESLTTAAVLVPLLIVVLTIVTMALQSYLMVLHGHVPTNLPTFVDIPFA